MANQRDDVRHSRLLWLAVALVGVAALAVYVATLAPAVPVGDSGELIAASYVAGVAHPPGYPLYTMIGWAVTHVWSGSPAVAMNLLSAVIHAATAALVVLTTARLVSPGWPRGEDEGPSTVAGIAAGLALALSTVFWLYSLMAEVFALNDLFAVALLLLAIEWYRDRSKTWALWSVGLLSGLATAHHQTIVLLAPALAVLVIAGIRADVTAVRSAKRRKRPPRQVTPSHLAVGALLIVVGLLPYLYLPIAAASDPVVNFGDPETPQRFVESVTRGPYGSFSLVPGGERGSLAENLGLYGRYLGRAFTPLGIALAGIGAVHLWRRRRTESWALLLAFLFTGVAFVAFANAPLESAVAEGVVERFYMLSSVPFAAMIGAGVFASIRWLRERVMWSSRKLVVGSAATVVVLATVLGALRWSDIDQSDNRVAELYGRDVLSRLEADALLLSRGDHNFTALTYAQAVAGERPDVVVLDLELLKLDSHVAERRARHPDVVIPFDRYDPDLPDQIVALVEANLGRRPVYAIGSLPELGDAVDEQRQGLVRRLRPGATSDLYELVLRDPTYVTGLHFPERPYPETSWEAVIDRTYGTAALSLGFALHQQQPVADEVQLVEMYELAIEHGGVPEAYKNLGVFLFERDRDPDRVISLWETYLELEPDDPQASSIRSAIEQLRSR